MTATLAHPDLVKLMDPSGVRLGHINTNGLRKKLEEVKILLEESNLDILAVTETHLSDEIEDSEPVMP